MRELLIVASRGRKPERGGHVCPTITCNPECIYVYEVIYDSSNEGKEP